MRRPYRTVDRIFDGDTIKVKRSIYSTRIIRLAGVDTPERGSQDMAVQNNSQKDWCMTRG